MSFKLWSELNKDAAAELRPNFGFISWNSLSKENRRKIWKYLEVNHFFNTKREFSREHKFADSDGHYYQFFGNPYELEYKQQIIANAILELNDKYKSRTYANKFLEDRTYTQACADFYRIFIEESENVVLELLSLYAQLLIAQREKWIAKISSESAKVYEQKKEKEKWQFFDEFATDINEVFSQFNLSVYLTRLGFTFRQEEKLIKEVFEPVIDILSNPQWKEVNKSLANAFSEYQKKTPLGYSSSVTNAVTAVQAFLQILCGGKIGIGDISKLIIQARKQRA